MLKVRHTNSLSKYAIGWCHVFHCYSCLFWSDGTNGNAKIERSDLAGNNRRVLVSSAQGLVSPTTLVVDFSSQKLYWLDSAAEKIGRVNFGGSHPFTQTISELSQVSAMTVYMVRTKYFIRRASSGANRTLLYIQYGYIFTPRALRS